MHRDGYGRLVVAHTVADNNLQSVKPGSVVPLLDLTGSGHGGRPEKFSNYVARQLGFKDGNECPELSKLASEYVRGSKAFEDSMDVYFSKEKEVELLCEMLVEELERCILSYFAFHWNQASLMISQVLSSGSDEKKLKNMVLTATRKQRFERVTKDLKVKRAFSTIVEEMKVMGCNITPKKADDGACTEVLKPMPQSDRSPVLLFMGGGMGAGKSTVLKEILKDAFWSGAAEGAVVVEADAFKETDVIYQALNSEGHHNDMLQTAELVHQTSTDAASSVLVTALNEGRDVIMDGTLSWEPFVEQTIAMARTVHKYRYRMGVGYKVSKDDGTVIEEYWEKVEDLTEVKKPYRIELVGVVCDPFLAVTRGIRRAIAVKRAVRVNSQLKSHKRFANAFPKYCHLVDNAKLYCTNAIGVPPTLIGYKDGTSNLLRDPDQIKCFETLSKINDEADSIYELYADDNTLTDNDSMWKQHAEVEVDVPTTGAPKKRTFKKFSFRGVDLDALLDMSTDELVKLFTARARRRFQRGLKRKPMALIKKLRKAKREAPPGEKPELVKTHLRNMIIVPEMIGSVVGVYNGKTFNQIEIKPEMIGHYLAEFSISYKPVKHGRPGIGATHSSRFIPLK
ncbi:hypothetical protein E3N88_07748 [Mikania micrantha]|uniref:Zeta toxin domain-containing protein n=1 Tax=Mikania micrantha TaxID=192012 RepID=A0A5N6PGC9_9ASTR|nr:hypothetical protein E3N88_07748 [Mikania micrantha]